MTVASNLKIAFENRPFHGERHSGDLPFFDQATDSLLLGLADALGHGEQAFKLASDIEVFMRENSNHNVLTLLEDMHRAFRQSIGAAISLARVNLRSGHLQFAGIGNVHSCVIGQTDRSFVCRDGILGQNRRSPLLQDCQLTPGDKVVFASDGIQQRFYTRGDRKLLLAEPRHVARYLITEFGKRHDDSSCLVFEF